MHIFATLVTFLQQIIKVESRKAKCKPLLCNASRVFCEVFLKMISCTLPALPVAKTNVTSVKIFGGESEYINCEATGKPMPTIQWLYPRNSGAMSIGDNLVLANVTVKDKGNYQCMAVNSKGRSNTNVTVIVLNQYPGKPTLEQMKREENSLTLQWKPPEYIGRGGKILGFVMKCSAINFDKKFNVSKLSHTFRQLAPSTKYAFSLSACNYYVCGEEQTESFETAERGKRTFFLC